MAYLRRRRIGKQTYLYVLETRYVAGKVRQVCLEYLGNQRGVSKSRVEAARRYWRIGQGRKPRKGGKS